MNSILTLFAGVGALVFIVLTLFSIFFLVNYFMSHVFYAKSTINSSFEMVDRSLHELKRKVGDLEDAKRETHKKEPSHE